VQSKQSFQRGTQAYNALSKDFRLITGSDIMSKSHDTKKAAKKEPAKTPKEKKEAKKVKKEAMKRQ